MQRAGTETLAVWREAGEWWKGEPDREVCRYVDDRGVRRETVKSVSPPKKSPPTKVRVRTIRDEKVSLAIGDFTPSNYGTPRSKSANGVLLHAQSAYSQGGTILASELAALAAEKGYRTVLLADRFSLAGAREFSRTANEVGVHAIHGVTVELAEGGELVLVASNADGYRSLARLVTDCHLEEARTYPLATWDRLARHTDGVICLSGGSKGVLDLHLVRREF